MKTIKSVALAAIKKYNIVHQNLFKTWRYQRVEGGYTEKITYHDFLHIAEDLRQNIIDSYNTHGCSKFRAQFSSCANLHLSIFVMGGYKDHPQWETEIILAVTGNYNANISNREPNAVSDCTKFIHG